MKMRLSKFLEAGEVEEAHGELERSVAGLAYDSREVKKGYVFFAVPGARADGHEFVSEAAGRGAAAVVVERPIALPKDVAWIRVRNVRRAMGKWAAEYFRYPSRRQVVVGVTGTNGKTTVTYLLESIFGAAGMATGVIGTVNYRYGGRTLPAPHTTPESLDLQRLLADMAQAGVQSVAMEVSSHALELERVRGIDFDAAVFTNLTRDHLDFHGDMERYFSAKSSLFTEYLSGGSKKKKSAVIHGGDPKGPELLEKARRSGLEVLSYGSGREWDVHPEEVQSDFAGLRGKISIRDLRFDFSSPLVGSANLENILGAAGAAFALGLPPRSIAEGLARLNSVPGRLEKIRNGRDLSVLVDYAHTPDALEKALSVLRPLARGRLIALFGCGGDRDRGKRPLMGEIAARLSDWVVLTSDNPRSEEPLAILAEIEAGVGKTGLKKFQISDLKSQISNPKSKIQNLKSERGYWVEPDRRAAIRLALQLARAGDLVLIAGKGHEDYQILGSKRIHFDDREVAKEELEKLSAVGDQHS
jgi:UDP-N-acetylmuramoyl-L-alanyl-D-glutamate--2,6-diaminopimelate ligase